MAYETRQVSDEKRDEVQKFLRGLPRRIAELQGSGGEPTNSEQAEWARVAIETYAHTTGIAGEERGVQISDLLADIMHLCEIEGVSFEGAAERAREHFEIELAEEDLGEELDGVDDENPAVGGTR